ncbi:hypothetical protein PVK06_004703 [Gossypium arboreum]|uniref:Uncharacterized protein n=1 Tax=Gossypium arboreum TaxID=29729 RepID=A0ABR0QTS4_GOSAR|nr:hypothetical protein PVK06_004703 [Gossypium arboreum]
MVALVLYLKEERSVIYCTELNIHNTCERVMGSEEELCEKAERKETLSDKSLLDGPNLMSENPYEVKIESSQVEKERKYQYKSEE